MAGLERHVTAEELSRHKSRDDCWIAVHSQVWDLTRFVDEHPGGPAVILKCAGGDASAAYDEAHAPGILEENLPVECLKGTIKGTILNSISANRMQEAHGRPEPERQTKSLTTKGPGITPGHGDGGGTPPPLLQTIINAADFERVAQRHLSPKTWAFYSSAATDCVTHQQNKALLRRIMLQPRVLRDVRHADTSRRILGHNLQAPFFVSPAAMARLAHPDGELALARAAEEEGIIQCVSSNAAYPLSSIIKSCGPAQPFFLQLYVNSDRRKTEELLRKVREGLPGRTGIRAIFLTVDAPVVGKREADERITAETAAAEAMQSGISGSSGGDGKGDAKGAGIGRFMGSFIDKALTWEDLAWIRDMMPPGVPLVLKGVQTVEDARLAVKYGLDGIMLSNHGGRCLDTSQPAILNLLELRLHCPEIFGRLEIYIDGGLERGTDILKAIALGATAVGIGRPYLYSLVYGQAGARHLTALLKDELETTMRLCGITSLDQATPELLNTADVDYMIRISNKFPPISERISKL